MKYSYHEDSTDLDKALAAEPETGTRQPILVSGRFNAGVRFDHSLSIVNSLVMHSDKADVIRAVFMTRGRKAGGRYVWV